MIDICIIGGGASGLAAAVSAAEQKQGRVLILEKKQVPGKKIAASGNGRLHIQMEKEEFILIPTRRKMLSTL